MIGKFISFFGRGMLFAGVIMLPLTVSAKADQSIPLAPPDARSVWFDIPAQPLAQALTEFGEQAGQAALVDSALAAGRSSSGIRGYYLPPVALRMLLRDTGLTAHYTSADAFTLVVDKGNPEASSAPMNDEGDTSTLGLGGNRYAIVIQRSVQRVLCQSPQTRPGEYRAVLQIWLATDGRVERVALLNSTGRVKRDSAILASLQRLRLEALPQSHLPQPLTILLLPGAHNDCPLSGVSRH